MQRYVLITVIPTQQRDGVIRWDIYGWVYGGHCDLILSTDSDDELVAYRMAFSYGLPVMRGYRPDAVYAAADALYARSHPAAEEPHEPTN